MISRYVERALRRARYVEAEDGSYCGTVAGLRGVISTGSTLEVCRAQLVEVIEEWILVRVARGLAVPPMGGARVEVKRAS
jgi:predicted RNase H-like HicB family nuclease